MAGTAMKLRDRVMAEEPAAAVTPPATPTKLRAETLTTITPLDQARAIKPLDAANSDSRKGKKATVGHFSEAMSRRLNILAKEEGRTLQSAMGEAWDMWLISRGKEPFGER